ncbi:MAG TPA: Spy/CpxP family protein refolding chaperone [Longimicrobium sp.]|nr:Spy/CpxP family protein refolding chaperone [Longimicrobium sp.]
MRRSAFLPLLGLALCAAPATAQGPGPMPGGPGPDPAGMLLAATGPLHLTDAQVVRLAAIARRAEERHAAMRTSMEAAHAAAAARQAPPDAEMARMHQAMERMHEQARADLRDALAVLTPDQQATAFEMVAMHPARGPEGGPGEGHHRMGPGGHGGPGGADMMRHPGGPPPPRDGAAPPADHPDAR